MVKLKKRVSIVGNSFAIFIDKPIATQLKLKKGDFVVIDLVREKK